MPIRSDYLESLDTAGGDVEKILRYSDVAQAAVFLERSGSIPERSTSQSRTFYDNSEEGAQRRDRENDSTLISPIGSLSKFLTAALVSTFVDKLSYSDKPEDEPYRRLRKLYPDPWYTSFTTIFNSFSKRKLSPLPKNPLLRHVLLHFNSLPPMNSILLAPDGTSLMSIEEFLEVAPRLSQDGDSIEYSNGNYILIGLLIQAIAPPHETLQTLMYKHIFQPLGMNHTYMSRTDAGDTPYARPHVASTRGRRELVHNPGYAADAIVCPAMGAFSCTKDLAILLRALLASLNGDVSVFSEDLVTNLLRPEGELDKAESDRQTLCGIYTTLDSSTPGSRSINRLITPKKVCSTYRLGIRPGKEVAHIPAYYMTGAVNGYSSCFYFIPKHNAFVIVLTNTSGRIDASDHISRLILQEVFDLERSARQRTSLVIKLFSKSLDLQKSDLKAKVDIVDMACRASQDGLGVLKEWERADTQVDMPGALSLQLGGTYRNELTHQAIIVWPQDDRLIVNMRGGAGTSRDIGLHRTGDFTFQLYPIDQDGFTIDRYDPAGWKELGFRILVNKDGDGNRTVVGIERQGRLLPSTSIYRRT